MPKRTVECPWCGWQKEAIVPDGREVVIEKCEGDCNDTKKFEPVA